MVNEFTNKFRNAVNNAIAFNEEIGYAVSQMVAEERELIGEKKIIDYIDNRAKRVKELVNENAKPEEIKKLGETLSLIEEHVTMAIGNCAHEILVELRDKDEVIDFMNEVKNEYGSFIGEMFDKEIHAYEGDEIYVEMEEF